MRINNNIMALNAHRQLGANQAAGARSMERLSSGLRINRAGDDAAGLAISEKMRGQIKGLRQASRNAQDGISMIQTAEGSLNETHAILQRIRELADQSASGTLTADDRKALQGEVAQLMAEVDRIGNTTEFNTQKLLNGSLRSAGGASVGHSSTSGAAIARLEAAALTSTADINTLGDGNFIKEDLMIDGAKITVNWQNLSTEEKGIIKAAAAGDASANNKAADLIINTINAAIDASDHNVAHIKGEVVGDTLRLTSGSVGINSQIKSETAGAVAGALGFTADTKGTANIEAAISSEVVDLRVNGVLMQLTTPAVSAGDALESVRGALETAINTAIGAYNGTTGKTTGQEGFIENVTVSATNDGRLVINSESGPVELADRAGTSAVEKLGLSQAQTEAGGNGGMTFQIGANRGQALTFGINDMRSAALGIAGVNVSTQGGAAAALDSLDRAISSVSTERSKLGAIQNRLEHTISNLGTSVENLQAAESRIRDLDMAEEMMAFTKSNILNQAATAMMAQANMAPQSVLQLLG